MMLLGSFVRVLLRRRVSRFRVPRRVADGRRSSASAHVGSHADVAVFHEFGPPPYGGGNQFLLALVGELERRGLTVEANRLSGGTPACLYNSFNFDFSRLERFARDGVRMVHRVDGPVGVYRGFDDGTDRRIADDQSRARGRDDPAVAIQPRQASRARARAARSGRDSNAVDPAIFHPPASRSRSRAGALRVIATSWSDNPRKGADVLAWLDRHLDFDSSR